MPLSARGDRHSETLCQSVGLRACPDKRRERSPFFFDRNQLGEHVVAVERFRARAERFTRGDGLRPLARQVGGLFGFPLAPCDGRFGGRYGAREAFREGGIQIAESVPRRRQLRELGAGRRHVRHDGQPLDGLAERRLPAAVLGLGGQTRGLGGFNLLQERARALHHGLLACALLDSAKLVHVDGGRNEPVEGGKRHILVLGVERDVQPHVLVGRPRQGSGGNRAMGGLPGNAGQGAVVRRSRESRQANGLGRRALGHGRQPLRVLDGFNSRESRAVDTGGRQREQPFGRTLLRLVVSVAGGHTGEHNRVVDEAKDGAPNAGIRVGLGEERELHRVVDFRESLETDCRVEVLPPGLGLEFVENTHGFKDRRIHKERPCRTSSIRDVTLM